ncbi:DNA (cytosine-5-)-methyltransferase [Spiroplasma clarkii]|nr:DNA (cytosine-5-)-methyltransferase [Spiroplasma clarkii]
MLKIRVFETFAGIGAQHKALKILKDKKILDFEIAGTSEWDMWANISYNAMHHNSKNVANKLDDETINEFLCKFDHSSDSKTPISNSNLVRKDRKVRELLYSAIKNCNNQGSILNVKGAELIKNIGEFDMLTYSFPCQDLSVAGSLHGFNQGMAKGSGTRSGLLWEIERILNELCSINKLPKYLLLENVRNMISERHKADYQEWIDFLHELGYNTQTYVLNAKDYGIPQSRERVYALSVRGEDKLFHDTYTRTGLIREKKNPTDISKKLKISKKIYEIIKVDYNHAKYREEAIESTPNRTPSRKTMYSCNHKLFSLSEEK